MILEKLERKLKLVFLIVKLTEKYQARLGLKCQCLTN